MRDGPPFSDEGPYFTERGRERRLEQLTLDVGGRVVAFGASVEGRPLRAAIVPCSSGASAPTVFVNANIHGVEWIGGLCALGVLAALGTERGRALRERATVVVAPCLNPDGYARTERQGGQGTLKEVRGNAHGVDLNRNFPLPLGARPFFLAMSGSSDPSRATWRGERAFSEPESRAVDALAAEHRFHATVSFHSFMGTLIPPKVTTTQDADAYRALCRAYRRGQNRFRNVTLMFPSVDVFTGELEDHLHHVHRGWALTVEVFSLWQTFRQHLRAPSIFARFNPQDPGEVIDDAVGGALSYFAAVLSRDRPS